MLLFVVSKIVFEITFTAVILKMRNESKNKLLLKISGLKKVMKKSWKKNKKTFGGLRKSLYLCTRFREGTREFLKRQGRLAQLVQSICLTSRGSAVRIRQRPQIDETKVASFFENLKHYSFGSLAQLNRAFDYGSKGYRFESCASHFEMKNWQVLWVGR